jgi:hypothetical protein
MGYIIPATPVSTTKMADRTARSKELGHLMGMMREFVKSTYSKVNWCHAWLRASA